MRTSGDAVFAALPLARVGDGVCIHTSREEELRGEVVAVERRRVAIAPFGAAAGVALGDRVEVAPESLECVAGFGALGRAFDGRGAAIDGKGALRGSRAHVAAGDAPAPGTRTALSQPLWTGLCAIDGLLTLARGSRIGIFGAAGTGKSQLLEAIARDVGCDAAIVALIGERGREAQEWLTRIDRRTILVCATSDRSAAERVRAAQLAMTQAEVLREAGLHVTLVLDSLARYAGALRELHVALGEPVGRAGYPAGVWLALARLLERAGNARRGSISVIATVLCAEDEAHDPLAEAARSMLDGHVVLSRELAHAGRFPAVDVLASASRTMGAVVSPRQLAAAQTVRGILARLAESEDLRAAGLADPNDPELAKALQLAPALETFLRQRERRQPDATLAALFELAEGAG